MVLSYEKYLEVYEDQLYIADAESGADREAGYDSDNSYEKHYAVYVESGGKKLWKT